MSGITTIKDKEFLFTQQDFTRIVGMIYRVAGISLSNSKQEMVYSRLTRRLRATGTVSFIAYLDGLEHHPQAQEWQHFVNALTTNLTAFFRENHHFPVLAEYARNTKQPLTVWCCAASTGEEPYSIAMTLCEAFNTLAPPVKIIATDIDTNVLDTAAKGVYALDRIDKLTPTQVSRFFLKGKSGNNGMAKIKPELSKLITFKSLNLLAPSWDVAESLDIIFCRNVMIYFDKPTQSKILSRFAPMLKPGGLLFAGHSENFTYVSDAFRLQGKTVYTRVVDK